MPHKGGRKPNGPFVPQPFQRHPEYHSRLARIEALLDSGYSHRAIARELGVSRQRVTQLVALVKENAHAA